jgi:hypothetical protein
VRRVVHLTQQLLKAGIVTERRQHRIHPGVGHELFATSITFLGIDGIGTSSAQVRAERTGKAKVPGDGRVYEIFFTASDSHGATCVGSVLVSVPHDEGSGPAIDSGVRYDSTVSGGQPLAKP